MADRCARSGWCYGSCGSDWRRWNWSSLHGARGNLCRTGATGEADAAALAASGLIFLASTLVSRGATGAGGGTGFATATGAAGLGSATEAVLGSLPRGKLRCQQQTPPKLVRAGLRELRVWPEQRSGCRPSWATAPGRKLSPRCDSRSWTNSFRTPGCGSASVREPRAPARERVPALARVQQKLPPRLGFLHHRFGLGGRFRLDDNGGFFDQLDRGNILSGDLFDQRLDLDGDFLGGLHRSVDFRAEFVDLRLIARQRLQFRESSQSLLGHAVADVEAISSTVSSTRTSETSATSGAASATLTGASDGCGSASSASMVIASSHSERERSISSPAESVRRVLARQIHRLPRISGSELVSTGMQRRQARAPRARRRRPLVPAIPEARLRLSRQSLFRPKLLQSRTLPLPVLLPEFQIRAHRGKLELPRPSREKREPKSASS